MYPKGCAKAFEALMQETPYGRTDAPVHLLRPL